jgi:hypothetical protein
MGGFFKAAPSGCGYLLQRIEAAEIRPVVSGTFSLCNITEPQKQFVKNSMSGSWSSIYRFLKRITAISAQHDRSACLSPIIVGRFVAASERFSLRIHTSFFHIHDLPYSWLFYMVIQQGGCFADHRDDWRKCTP